MLIETRDLYLSSLQMKAIVMPNFINPYSFVSLPDSVDRKLPEGHDRVKTENFVGTLKLRFTAQTRLMLGSAEDTALPGSSIHGAVRSLHETLMDSCYRVLDVDFVPSFRMGYDTDNTEWKNDLKSLKLAVVNSVENGKPVLNIADDFIRIVPSAFALPPRSGDRFSDSDVKALSSGNQNKLVRDLGSGQQKLTRDENGGWVVHVVPLGAKNAGSKNRVYLFKPARTSRVTDTAWQAYMDALQGSDRFEDESDLELDRGQGVIPSYGPWRSDKSDEWVREGLTFFVKTNDFEVTELRLSQVWRKAGSGTIGERLNEGSVSLTSAHPCGHEANSGSGELPLLCPSCRLFGSADTSGKDTDGRSAQRSYRGHVFVGESTISGETSQIARLSPLVSPKPSAGQFYLDTSQIDVTRRNSSLTPLAQWGSAADKPRMRRIRGRKHYWASDDASNGKTPPHDRAEARNHDGHKAGNNTIQENVVIHRPQTTIETEIQLVNVTREQLATLLVALKPALLFENAVLRLGGGKPFGFGAVTTEILDVELWKGADRYLGKPPTFASPSDVEQLAGEASSLISSKSEIAKLVSLNPALGSADVWYPRDSDTPSEASFDTGFDFWKKSSGDSFVEPKKLIPLPDATDDSQVMSS